MGVEEATRDKQVESTICWATLRRYSLNRSLKINPTYRWDGNVVNSFATHAKRHFDKAMDDRQATTNLAKTVAELSNRLKHVANASKRLQSTFWDIPDPPFAIPITLKRLTPSWISPPHSPDTSDGNSEIDSQNLSLRWFRKSQREEGHWCRPKSRSYSGIQTSHHAVRRPSRPSQTTSHWSTGQRCSSRSILYSHKSSISSPIT